MHSRTIFLSDTIQGFPLPLLIEIIRFFSILLCSISLKLSFKILNRLWSLQKYIYIYIYDQLLKSESAGLKYLPMHKIHFFIFSYYFAPNSRYIFSNKICILLQFVFPSYTLFSPTGGMSVLLLIMQCNIIPLSKISGNPSNTLYDELFSRWYNNWGTFFNCCCCCFKIWKIFIFGGGYVFSILISSICHEAIIITDGFISKLKVICRISVSRFLL